ncbi:acyl transferase [Sphingobacterium gobiense]|uniref:Acyl transferase n=1 Tax=Sphingobacterium gobiense TaxID=1382456 RepID=A0A2S9JUF0_9SPHI|nr:acyl transferase [Sphingobacterium gobiense]PRD56893.1 acyl transferase [Sphingobacterium gobiense]
MSMQEHIFSINSEETFNEVCLKVYRYQKANCSVYGKYVDLLGKGKTNISHYTQIPFLPIDFFKTQRVLAEGYQAEIIFTSSGTTGVVTSKHHVANVSWYQRSFRSGFQRFYGKVKNMAVLALLPSYLERSGSSLIYMVDDLIVQSQHPLSGYFLYNHEDLFNTLYELKQRGTKTLLIGVTYALLDFCEQYQVDFPNLKIMETGGMKGRRKEMIREELHQTLTKGFGVQKIHSEYGMTELLSQGYSFGEGVFQTPPWMKVLLRDTDDPLSLINQGKTGAINVIDLANYYSCSFIATQDLGKQHMDGRFEILGRFDNSDIRGCNLLVQ